MRQALNHANGNKWKLGHDSTIITAKKEGPLEYLSKNLNVMIEKVKSDIVVDERLCQQEFSLQ